MTLESTDITPFPPKDKIGTIWSSFPEYIVRLSPHKLAIFATCDMLPLASFMATMFSILDSSRHVSGVMLTPVLEATLYTIIGLFTSFAIAL